MKIRNLPWGLRAALILLLAMGEVVLGVFLGMDVAGVSFSWAILPPLFLTAFLMPEEFQPRK
ncbi:hypothetical protein SDC9_176215 [bioreactor metagenome]|uniref:Uncharacterized protein n=1 Tax=bioreactor metagenome TaxID=1076179 RepID=A0A645GRA4_9ZZZZ